MEVGEGFVNEDGIVFNPNQGDIAMDPNNINYDADGNVESIYDPESGKTFKNKEEEPLAETPEEAAARIASGEETPEEATARIAAGNETEEEKAARILAESETPEEKEARLKAETPPDYVNSADYVLKLSGYNNEEVELESGRKKISELTPDEQLSIVIQEYDNAREGQQEAINTAKKESQDNLFQNEGEKEIIAFLRDKGDPIELAKYILEQSPSLVADMSDEDAVRKQIRDDFPQYTEEDINDEVDLLKNGGKLERRATLIKEKYKDKEVDVSDLNKKLGLRNEKVQAQENKSHQTKMSQFLEFAKEQKEMAGIPMSEEIRDYLIAGAVTENPGDKTEFQKSLDDPKKLMRLRFLDTYFEKIVENLQKQSFLKGKTVGDNMVRKFSDKPITLAGNKKEKEKVKQPKTVDELDVDHMIEVAEQEF
jgi:hypothetical protein